MPEPLTKRALLTHARTGVVGWHRYVATILGKVPERKYTDDEGIEQVLPGGPAWLHIFESTEQDPVLRAQRVWGCDDSEAGGAA